MQVMQTNYHTMLTHDIKFVCLTWCVIALMISKKKHSDLKVSTADVVRQKNTINKMQIQSFISRGISMRQKEIPNKL